MNVMRFWAAFRKSWFDKEMPITVHGGPNDKVADGAAKGARATLECDWARSAFRANACASEFVEDRCWCFTCSQAYAFDSCIYRWASPGSRKQGM